MALYDPEESPEQNSGQAGGEPSYLHGPRYNSGADPASKSDDPSTLAQKENDTQPSGTGPTEPSVSEPQPSEKNNAGGGLQSAVSDQLGKGFTMAAGPEAALALKVVKGVARFLGTHKKSSYAGVGVGGGVVGLILLGFGAILPLEIVHIEENLLGYEFKIEEHFEKKAASDIMQKIINWQLNKTPAEEAKAAGQAGEEGQDFTKQFEDFQLTSEPVEKALGDEGITVETEPAPGGGWILKGLENSSGQNITDEIGNDGPEAANVESALPEDATGQVESFRPTMTAEAGSDFSGIPPDTPDDKVQTVIEEGVTNGATPAEYAAAEGEETGKQPPPQDAKASANFAAENEIGGSVGTAEEIVQSNIDAGKSVSAALQAGVDSLKGLFSNKVFIAGFISALCSIEKDFDKAAQARVPEIMSLLIRHGTTVLSLADQVKSGDMTSGQLSQVMTLFNGDPSVTPTANDPRPEAAMPFSDSAAWQRATGGAVNTNINDSAKASYTPDISPSSLPTQNSGTVVVNEIQGVLNITGGAFFCEAITSGVGWFVQTAIGAIQLIGGLADFETSQAVISGILIGSGVVLDNVILPQVLEYFSPVGLSGNEDSVQWLNNSDAGLNLASNTYARRLGANPVPNSTADSLYSEASQDQVAAEDKLPWTDRVFALSNPDSLASILLDKLPIGPTTTSLSYGIVNSIFSIPSDVFGDLVSVVSPTAFAQSAPTNPGQPYGLTQYAFTDSELEQYDPVANEQYLFTNVTAGGQSISRIAALGNPTAYIDNPGGDPNTNDLLHCYVDSYTLILEDIDSANNYCGSVGTYDYANPLDNPSNVPGDQTVISIYCDALNNPHNCAQTMAPQVDGHNDVGHFRQYLLDTHIMNDYTSLTTNT